MSAELCHPGRLGEAGGSPHGRGGGENPPAPPFAPADNPGVPRDAGVGACGMSGDSPAGGGGGGDPGRPWRQGVGSGSTTAAMPAIARTIRPSTTSCVRAAGGVPKLTLAPAPSALAAL